LLKIVTGLLILINITMEALDAIFNRRSIRQYTSEQIADEQIEILLKAGMYAPSAVNKQPWEFIVFRNQDTMRRIVEVHPNASMLLKANTAILICWDEQRQHDIGYGPVDCAAATQNILLAAHSMGLGAVWVGIYPRQPRMEAIKSIFRLPDHIRGFSIVALGHPAEKRSKPERFDKQKIHLETW
jgi:nitroreductase